MTELLITSSVLIGIVLLLRGLSRGKVSRSFQYALWLLVLLRLALPFPLLSSPLSVMNLADFTQGGLWAATEAPGEAGAGSAYGENGLTGGGAAVPDPLMEGVLSEGPALGSGLSSAATPPEGTLPTETNRAAALAKATGWIWFGGAAAFGLWFLLSNLLFYRKLCRERTPWAEGLPPITDCKLPIYVVEQLPSPCLFGLIRPAIYLTPKALEEEDSFRCVIAHEFSHYRQKDHLWSFLRSLCLAAYWFDPLVWVAAFCSRRDGELACDEKTVTLLGGEHSAEYGRALIRMISVKTTPSRLFCTATTMASGKREIRQRLDMIVSKPRNRTGAVLAVLLVLALAAGCTFTGVRANPTEENSVFDSKEGPGENDEAPGPNAPLTEQEALDALVASLGFSGTQLTFTIPENYPHPERWNIHVSGRQEFLDGFSTSVHFLEDVIYTAGQEYVISNYGSTNLGEDPSVYTDLDMDIAFTGMEEGGPSLTVNLLPYLDASRPDRSGEVPLPLSQLPTELYDSSKANWEKDSAWLLASIPQQEVYIYGLNLNTNAQGVFVRWGESTYFGENWYYMTPRQVLPQVACGDYDGDGEKELALSLYIASGTGVGISDLHIFEQAPDGSLTTYQFEDSEYLPRLNEVMSWDHNAKEGTVEIRVGDAQELWPVKDIPGTFQELYVTGNIVDFQLSDSGIKGRFSVEVISEGGPYFLHYGAILADIRFAGGAFVMENYSISRDI